MKAKPMATAVAGAAKDTATSSPKYGSRGPEGTGSDSESVLAAPVVGARARVVQSGTGEGEVEGGEALH